MNKLTKKQQDGGSPTRLNKNTGGQPATDSWLFIKDAAKNKSRLKTSRKHMSYAAEIARAFSPPEI